MCCGCAEQAEYTRENIEWKSIVFEDNKDCLELIEGRAPPGMLALIDEQCMVKVRFVSATVSCCDVTIVCLRKQSSGDDDKSKGRADAASKGRGDEPVVTQADQSLAQKLYNNLEKHGRFLVTRQDKVTCSRSFLL